MEVFVCVCVCVCVSESVCMYFCVCVKWLCLIIAVIIKLIRLIEPPGYESSPSPFAPSPPKLMMSKQKQIIASQRQLVCNQNNCVPPYLQPPQSRFPIRKWAAFSAMGSSLPRNNKAPNLRVPGWLLMPGVICTWMVIWLTHSHALAFLSSLSHTQS